MTNEIIDDRIPKCFALITGHIIKAEKKINEIMGNYFYWALVRTVEGLEMDVVIEPSKLLGNDDGSGINNNDPIPMTLQEGGVIQGCFWLSGRVVTDDNEWK